MFRAEKANFQLEAGTFETQISPRKLGIDKDLPLTTYNHLVLKELNLKMILNDAVE